MECGVEQMGRGVIALRGEAFAHGYFGAELIARGDVRVGVDLVDSEARYGQDTVSRTVATFSPVATLKRLP